jgi:hypothetical protein
MLENFDRVGELLLETVTQSRSLLIKVSNCFVSLGLGGP